MKALICAAALLASAAFPANAEVRFLGTTVTTTATNCAYTEPGDGRVSAFRPPAVAGNPNSGGLTMLTSQGGYTIEFPGPLAALNTFQSVSTVEQGAFGFDVYTTRIKFNVRTPATITATTKTIYLEGTIEEPFGEKFSPGLCVVTFRSSLVKLLD